jgi:hypothetical protein
VDLHEKDLIQHTRAKKVITYLEHQLSLYDPPILPSGIHSPLRLTLIQSDVVFEQLYSDVISRLYFGAVVYRSEELSYGRIYNVTCAYKKNN